MANRRHSRLQQLLSSYIDGEVDPAELREVEEHLAACDSCRRELDTLRFTVGLLRELPEVSVRRSFSLSEAPVPIRTAPFLGWGAGLATSVAAVLLVALLLGDITGVLVQTPGLEMDALAAREQAVAPLPAAPAEVRVGERETVVSEEAAPVVPAAPAAQAEVRVVKPETVVSEEAAPDVPAAPATAASAQAMPMPTPAPATAAPAPPAMPAPAPQGAEERAGIEVTVQTESETQVVEPRSLAAPAPAPPEPSRPAAPIDAAVQQDPGVAAAAPESTLVPSAPGAEEPESPPTRVPGRGGPVAAAVAARGHLRWPGDSPGAGGPVGYPQAVARAADIAPVRDRVAISWPGRDGPLETGGVGGRAIVTEWNFSGRSPVCIYECHKARHRKQETRTITGGNQSEQDNETFGDSGAVDGSGTGGGVQQRRGRDHGDARWAVARGGGERTGTTFGRRRTGRAQ